MGKSYKKGLFIKRNAWGQKPGMVKFLVRFSVLLHARAARGRFGSLQRFFDELEPGRHKSHVITDIARGASYLSIMGITVGKDEFGFKVETKCGFSQYLSHRRVKKEKEATNEKNKRVRCESTGRFFWEDDEGERSDSDYKSFL